MASKEHRPTDAQKGLMMNLHGGQFICSSIGTSMTGRNYLVPAIGWDSVPYRSTINNNTVESLLRHGYMEEAGVLKAWDDPDISSIYIRVFWKLSKKGLDKLIEERLI